MQCHDLSPKKDTTGGDQPRGRARPIPASLLMRLFPDPPCEPGFSEENISKLSEFYFEGADRAFTNSELLSLLDFVEDDLNDAEVDRALGEWEESVEYFDFNPQGEMKSRGPGPMGGVWHMREWEGHIPLEVVDVLDYQEIYDDFAKFESEVARDHMLRWNSVVVQEIPHHVSGADTELIQTYIRCEPTCVPCHLISTRGGRDGYSIGITEYGEVWIPPKMKKSISIAQGESQATIGPAFNITMRVVGGSRNPWKATWINM
jgi:hypothetical protein